MTIADLERLGMEKKIDDIVKIMILLTCCLLGTLVICLFSSCDKITVPARADIVSVARSQIGKGEIGGNNKGIYIRQYLGGREGLPWCAGFISYCAKNSGLNLPYTLRAKDFLKSGKRVVNPQPGDLIVFSRQGGGHVGIIEKVTKETITTIEGNLGDYPSKVKRVNYKRNYIKNLLAFIRIEKNQNE